MKRIFFLYGLMACIHAIAQPPYPTAPAVPELQQMEYFFDTDPGIGNGRSITINAGAGIDAFSWQLDLTNVLTGLHRVYFRSKDADGKWSLTNHAFFDNFVLPVYPSSSAVVNIVSAEYFIDTDPGFNKATPVTLTPGNNLVGQNLAVNVTGLTAGTHKVYVRAKDVNDRWSLVAFGQFDNTAVFPYPSAPAPAPALGEMEYYFDTDPGFGKATPIQFTSTTDLSNFSVSIPLNSVSAGPHTFYIRSRQNPWSFSAFVPFLYSSTLPVTWLYVKGELKETRAFIDWATATEEETDKFQVEHSTDGQHFDVVGEVAAAGNSGSTKQYRSVHTNPEKGMNYYRIKQLDKSGRFTYSKALHLLYQPDRREAIVTPNPVSDQLYIVAGTGNKIRKIELYDISGKLVIIRQLNNNQAYSVDISSLKNGIYIVKLYEDKTVTSHRIVKQ